MVNIRPAVKEDSADIARLFLISSDGLAEYIWSHVAEPGETVAEAGARRYAREGVAFSYENCLMAEVDGETVGMAHAYPMEADPGAAGGKRSGAEALRRAGGLRQPLPLRRGGLRAPSQRRRRTGADGGGERAGKGPLASAHQPHLFRAQRRRHAAIPPPGFPRTCARRPIVPHPCLHYADGDAVLLARETWI